MPVDPESVAQGKSYLTETGHIRTVLEVAGERVRYAHGGTDIGGSQQWRWQTKEKFAHDAAKEIKPEASPPAPAVVPPLPDAEPQVPPSPRSSGRRPILSKRK